jgi:hypothetical protein
VHDLPSYPEYGPVKTPEEKVESELLWLEEAMPDRSFPHYENPFAMIIISLFKFPKRKASMKAQQAGRSTVINSN